MSRQEYEALETSTYLPEVIVDVSDWLVKELSLKMIARNSNNHFFNVRLYR
ncbi:MAG: hypothetical protein WBC96_05715 [Thermodesulfobacteriota bacterium]